MSEEWKVKARSILKNYYLAFGGGQWHVFDTDNELELLQVKLCYALYGESTNSNASTIQEAYNDEQKKEAQEIIKNIKKVERQNASSIISVGFAFVVCSQKKEKREERGVI